MKMLIIAVFVLSILTVCAGGSSAQTANLFAGETSAQKCFENFDVKILIEKCDEDTCEGEATVYLFRKNQKQVFQKIRMPEMYLELGENKKPTANLIEIYGENNSGVVFDDYNFDGVEDLALRSGNNGNYNGPSYDVLLYSKTRNKFTKNIDLTDLGNDNLGLFTVDKKQKTLETFNKSGCCWHQTTHYKVINNRPVKVYVFTEDVISGNDEKDDKVKLTNETRVKGRWRKITKTVLARDYYKDN